MYDLILAEIQPFIKTFILTDLFLGDDLFEKFVDGPSVRDYMKEGITDSFSDKLEYKIYRKIIDPLKIR